ncbi:MAG: hypothetical protein WBB67_10840 [bacterium]
MKKNRIVKTAATIFALLIIYCTAVNIFAARYYRLLEFERKIFLGLKAIDTLAAEEYINLPSASERRKYYNAFWEDKETADREQFEERIEHAFRQYGKHSPISDERIQIFVKYGEPLKREEIWPQKKIAVKVRESVKPAEIWTYKREGLIFDFVRYARAYKMIARSEFGEHVKVPHLKEVHQDSFIEAESTSLLEFAMTTGRFRQKKNLTRLEVYLSVLVNDTTGISFSRQVKVFDNQDNIVKEKNSILIPVDSDHGVFFDEVNFWLDPAEYRLEITMSDISNRTVGKKTLWVNLLDYQDDAKEISDLVPMWLVDNTFSHEKFNKPVGRVIPMTRPVLLIHTPFYFYAEVYNLETKNGMHQLKMTYEVINKAKMKREIVDVVIKDQIEAGDVAYLAALYHPMDLEPGFYIITLRTVDLLSSKERTAVCEFELQPIE